MSCIWDFSHVDLCKSFQDFKMSSKHALHAGLVLQNKLPLQLGFTIYGDANAVLGRWCFACAGNKTAGRRKKRWRLDKDPNLELNLDPDWEQLIWSSSLDKLQLRAGTTVLLSSCSCTNCALDCPNHTSHCFSQATIPILQSQPATEDQRQWKRVRIKSDLLKLCSIDLRVLKTFKF